MKLNPIVNDLVYYYTGVLDDPYGLIDLIEDTDNEIKEDSLISKWSDWKTSSDDPYIFGTQKKFSWDTGKEKNEKINFIYKKINSAIEKASKHYGLELGIDIGFLLPLSIGKYQTGSYMGPHCDTYSPDSKATISVVLYLNDNYTGGDLNFPNQGIRIKPEAGSIIVFPSRDPYLHESLEISSGTKYISPGFWQKH